MTGAGLYGKSKGLRPRHLETTTFRTAWADCSREAVFGLRERSSRFSYPASDKAAALLPHSKAATAAR
jgi:hypothetical protein